MLHLDKTKKETDSEEKETNANEKKEETDDGEEVNSARTNFGCDAIGSVSCTKIVLLDIFHPSRSDNVIRVYALIDEQSNASMISPELIDKLGVVGKKEKYFLSTCSGVKEAKYGRRVPGLMVTSIEGKSSKLPTLIECDYIPQDKREIPTEAKVKQFPHLREIARKIPPLDPKAEVCVLIGRDAPELMKVREFRNGPKGTPWAHKLSVGWTVCGQVCLDRLGGAVHISTHRTTIYNEHLDSFDTTRTPNAKEEFARDVIRENSLRYEFTPCPNKVTIKETFGNQKILDDVYHTTIHDNEATMSVEDKRFLEIMEKETHKNEHGNWEMPLPFRTANVTLPNNREQAVSRFNSLLRSFARKPQMEKHYFKFMEKLLKRRHAEPVSYKVSRSIGKDVVNRGNVWYLPHFGVYHPRKPDQIRVVFDSSAEFQGVALNKELLPGPDVLNSLHGVLIRFRQENIALMCDVKQMFHCFHVNPTDRDTLRFLWFKDNDCTNEIIEYHMNVHLFGNTCSPAIATFGLRKTADDGEEKFGRAAKEFVCSNFYVDDGLTSSPTTNQAIDLVKSTKGMLATANLRLHKIVSNSVEVMEALPKQDRVENVRDLDLHKDLLPAQRSLGVQWNLEKDAFTFRVSLSEKPYTRRGVLAVVNAVYDPLGFATPVTLKGRLLLRQLVAMGNKRHVQDPPLGWDDLLPEGLNKEWRCWKDSLVDLESVIIPRCYHPKQFGNVVRTELHSFSDASQDAIGATTYLRQINCKGEVSVSLVFAQARLGPKQATTIPRMELCAAVLSTLAVGRIRKDLTLTVDEVVFYTDSRVVLGYIQNESRRFYVYVANRVQIIRNVSESSQWRYIDTTINPANLATKSIAVKQLMNSRWFKGPEFLSDNTPYTPPCVVDGEPIVYDDNDPEIRPQITVYTIGLCSAKELNSDRFKRFSKWSSLRRALANLIVKAKEFKNLKNNEVDRPHPPRQLSSHSKTTHLLRAPSLAELKQAKTVMIKTAQIEAFAIEMKVLQQATSDGNSSRNNLTKSSIYKLDPFIDEDGVLRVGGRLRRADLMFEEKHPAILPKGSYLATLAIEHYHNKVFHQGRQITHGAIRQAGIWIIGASRMIAKIIGQCVICRKLRGKNMIQQMADLPAERLDTPPPFTNVGLDVFGPWSIQTRRLKGGATNSKSWGLIFTCLNCRGIHIELLETMETSSFICALRRFISIRGPPSILRCDRGTNFIGGKSELDQALHNMDHKAIANYVNLAAFGNVKSVQYEEC